MQHEWYGGVGQQQWHDLRCVQCVIRRDFDGTVLGLWHIGCTGHPALRTSGPSGLPMTGKTHYDLPCDSNFEEVVYRWTLRYL